MAANEKKKSLGIEWVGGLVSLPGYVMGEGELFRPETLLWLSAEEQLGEGDEEAPSYLSPELGPDAIASLFRAAAGLFRAQPWKHVPSDLSVLSVTIEKLELRDAVLSVIGQMGQSLGIVLFSGLEDFEAYLDAAEAVELGEEPELPPHFALNFERGDDLPAALRLRSTSTSGWSPARTHSRG